MKGSELLSRRYVAVVSTPSKSTLVATISSSSKASVLGFVSTMRLAELATDKRVGGKTH